MALLCVCFGLRISEALSLRWSDVDWLDGKLRVERGIVCQIVDDVKSEESRKKLHIDSDLLDTLKLWKQTTQFSAPGGLDFFFSGKAWQVAVVYDQVWRVCQKARAKAGIGGLGTHSLRHLPFMAGRSGNSHCRATKAHAARSHPHNGERLRGHRDG